MHDDILISFNQSHVRGILRKKTKGVNQINFSLKALEITPLLE